MKKVFMIEDDFYNRLVRQVEEWLKNIVEQKEDGVYSNERITIIVEVIDENKPKLLKTKEDEK